MNFNDVKISDKYNVTVGDVLKYLTRPTDYKKKQKIKKQQSDAAVLSATIGGFVTGFIAAILLTPESGAKLRGELSETVKEAGKKVSEFTDKEAKKIKAYVNEK